MVLVTILVWLAADGPHSFGIALGCFLEHAGVIPDTLMLPTASELQSGSDPAMAYAVQQAGGKITPEDAGKLFPAEWPPLSTAVFGSH